MCTCNYASMHFWRAQHSCGQQKLALPILSKRAFRQVHTCALSDSRGTSRGPRLFVAAHCASFRLTCRLSAIDCRRLHSSLGGRSARPQRPITNKQSSSSSEQVHQRAELFRMHRCACKKKRKRKDQSRRPENNPWYQGINQPTFAIYRSSVEFLDRWSDHSAGEQLIIVFQNT